MLFFLSISFLSFLFQLYPIYDYSQHDSGFWNQTIGFPLQYYSQFMTDGILHFEWEIANLFIDIFIIWGSTLLGFILLDWLRKRNESRSNSR